jgi:hypothetical protein
MNDVEDVHNGMVDSSYIRDTTRQRHNGVGKPSRRSPWKALQSDEELPSKQVKAGRLMRHGVCPLV